MPALGKIQMQSGYTTWLLYTVDLLLKQGMLKLSGDMLLPSPCWGSKSLLVPKLLPFRVSLLKDALGYAWITMSPLAPLCPDEQWMSLLAQSLTGILC